MGRRDEYGDASAFQKQDLGSRSLFTPPRGNQLSMDIQDEAQRDDTINWYKAPLVAKGYAQTHEIDYEETRA